MAGIRDPLCEDPPPSRFDPDELDFLAPIPDAARTPPRVEWEPLAEAHLKSGKLHPEFLIVALSTVATNIIHHLPDKNLLGKILLPGNSSVKKEGERSILDKTACIYTCKSCTSVVIVSVQYHVPEEGANMWTKTLFQNIQPERVLIVALTPIHHFRGKLSSDDPSFFLLETDQQKREEKADLIYSKREEAEETKLVAPYYPSGSLVDGLPAALLTHCQLRGLRGRLLVTWPAEDSRMAQMLAATLTNVLRLIPQGSNFKFLEAVKILIGKKHLAANNLYM
ncbi:hypothetical protein MPTK1_8g11340 [Marchantia polymorpha subsp. ruderalis]|uniref:Uncharacterized protein n=1 Tax=Marchantia polymorpha TaxID=3197 RepID=A0A2R6XMG2_MARPO|nr:hypothetical protein MARPO_0008s0082 [Marchantia polymorpha]BBN19519.1 hypothetical protein Mp_8g11340 [Marchantia polymorpha subsp. ruderalis]|eukprot:PTQ47305.1 hypothetical protein MARPO_0008s0082 [Marchantia polymorpha]